MWVIITIWGLSNGQRQVQMVYRHQLPDIDAPSIEFALVRMPPSIAPLRSPGTPEER